MKLYVGTYSQEKSQGIYELELNEKNGTIENSKLFASVKNSKYLAIKNNMLYSVFEENKMAGVKIFNLNGEELASLLFEEIVSCYIFVDENNIIYTANYHLGTISKLKFENNKITLIKTLTVKVKAGCHQVISHNNQLFIPCLLIDKLLILTKDLNLVEEISFPTGSGPRHGVISLDNKHLYLVSELKNELYTFKITNESLELINKASIVPNSNDVAAGSAIKLSPDGNNIFVSVREINIISVFQLVNSIPQPIEFFNLTGNHPRDISEIINNKFLLVANRLTNNVFSYEITQNKSFKKCSEITVPEGVCIVSK